MEYKAETIYKQDDFIGFMKAYVHKTDNLRVMAKVSQICVRAAGVLLFFAGAFNMGKAGLDYFHGANFLTMRQASFQLVLIAAGVLLLAIRIDDVLGKIAWARYEGQGMKISYCFFDDYFTRTMQGNEHKFSYESIKSVYLDPYRYYLFVSGASAHIIPLASIDKGEAEAFGAFLQEKTCLEEANI
ncbi:MAG: YcxB family protein [Clostridiaceae bacterium]|nr:YcxB family protein [Clostridiaceae bacterium]